MNGVINEEKKQKVKRPLTAKEKKQFEKAYEEYYIDVRNIALKIVKDMDDAEEITQETFTKYYENPDTYNPEYTFKSFLMLSAKCRAISFLRQKARRSDIVSEKKYDLMDDVFADKNINKRIEQYDERQIIDEALKNLKESYRDAIVEVFIKRKPYKEAAEALNISETNLKVIVHRAKKKLKEDLEGKGFKEYFINFLVIGLIVFGLTCTYNIARKKLFNLPKNYSYNDNSIAVNAEVLERYKHILGALNIENDGSIITQYVPINRDNQDVLHLYNDKFEMRIFNDEILDFAVNFDNLNYLEVDEKKVEELDCSLYGDEIKEVKTVANKDYKMINVIISDEEYRIYTLSKENKLMQIRNMEQYFITQNVELNKEDIENIIKNEYGENIEIKSIELTQTKLNVLMTEEDINDYHRAESIDKYKDINLARKNFNFYLVWKVEFVDRINGINKSFKKYIDTFDGTILKDSTRMLD